MSKTDSSAATLTGARGFLIGPAFIALAIWFLWGPNLAGVPVTAPAVVPPGMLSTAARRTPLIDPPATMIAGMAHGCMDCHAIFKVEHRPAGERLQHAQIVLNHGINDDCRNCHDLEDLDRLVLYGGKSIPYADVVQLCSKCHGPTYEDWVHGMHGRINGYWDTSRGAAHKLGCTECHNPHSPRHPAMEPIPPLPAPHTFRMGDQSEWDGHDVDEVDPLRRALHLADEAARRSYERRAAERQEDEHK